MFKAKVVLDSLAPCGKRLVTIETTYPRFIHSEVLTHRDRARNSASSRAIPFPSMCERISADPVIPIRWGLEEGGMVQGGELPPVLQELAEAIWLEALQDAMSHAQNLFRIGATALQLATNQHNAYRVSEEWKKRVLASNISEDMRIHKSIPNRMIEPWMWITVIMTATEWQNFFRLRCHADAEVHFQRIAAMIRGVIESSTPTPRRWHRPYVTGYDEEELQKIYTEDQLNRISVARCARVSYLTHDGKRDPDKDLSLFDRLATGSGFGHYSPMEMVAEAMHHPTRSGPYVGWFQYRKHFPLENLEG